MDLTEQRRLSADAAHAENGTLAADGTASTSGHSRAATAPAADVFFEAEVMNRTEHSVEVALGLLHVAMHVWSAHYGVPTI